MILTVQILDPDNTVEILIDADGLDFLRQIINKDWIEPIKNESNFYDIDHEHLNSKEWGGNELFTEFTSESAKKVHSLKIVYLGKDGKSNY